MGFFLCRERRKCNGGKFFALFYTVFKASAFWFGLEVYCLKLMCVFSFFLFWSFGLLKMGWCICKQKAVLWFLFFKIYYGFCLFNLIKKPFWREKFNRALFLLLISCIFMTYSRGKLPNFFTSFVLCWKHCLMNCLENLGLQIQQGKDCLRRGEKTWSEVFFCIMSTSGEKKDWHIYIIKVIPIKPTFSTMGSLGK